LIIFLSIHWSVGHGRSQSFRLFSLGLFEEQSIWIKIIRIVLRWNRKLYKHYTFLLSNVSEWNNVSSKMVTILILIISAHIFSFVLNWFVFVIVFIFMIINKQQLDIRYLEIIWRLTVENYIMKISNIA
jgi:hypothetical protein